MDTHRMKKTKIFSSGGGEWMPGMKAANGYKQAHSHIFVSVKSGMMAEGRLRQLLQKAHSHIFFR